MPPFGPEGNPALVEAVRAVLAPLALAAAAASIVWSLQDRLVSAGGELRDRAARLRDPGAADGDDRAQVSLLLRRARLLQGAVVGFYAALLCHLFSAVAVAALLAGVVPPPVAASPLAAWLVLCPFFVGLGALLAASALALADTHVTYRAARREAGVV